MMYPVYCSWCAAEGRTTLTGWCQTEKSSGMCAECYARLYPATEEEIGDAA